MSRKPIRVGSASARARMAVVRDKLRDIERLREVEPHLRELAAKVPCGPVLEVVGAAMPGRLGPLSKHELTQLRNNRAYRLAEAVLSLHNLAQCLEQHLGLDVVYPFASTDAQRRAFKILALAARPDRCDRVAHWLCKLAEKVCVENAEHDLRTATDADLLPTDGNGRGPANAVWRELSERLIPTLLSGRHPTASNPPPLPSPSSADIAGAPPTGTGSKTSAPAEPGLRASSPEMKRKKTGPKPKVTPWQEATLRLIQSMPIEKKQGTLNHSDLFASLKAHCASEDVSTTGLKLSDLRSFVRRVRGWVNGPFVGVR